MTAYRDDLDAALARNHALAQRVRELEGAVEDRRPTAPVERRVQMPVPVNRERLAREASSPSSRIVYAPPATYVPCARLFRRYVELSWRSLVDKVPSTDTVAPPASNIIVLEMLRSLFLVAWIPFVFVVKIVWFVLGMLWFVISVPLVGVATAIAVIVTLPVVVLASFRTRHAGAALPIGVRWGDEVTDVDAVVYAATVAFGLAMVGMFVGLFIAVA